MSDRESATAWTEGAGAQQQFIGPYEEFRARLQRAWPSPEAEGAVTGAYAAYQSTLQEPWQSPELARRATLAYAECRRHVRNAFAGAAGDQIQDAFRRYAADLKAAWMTVDPATLTPQELAVVAQAMVWVAGVAGEIDSARSGSAEWGSRP
jgi:hypothetical protein